MFYTCLYIDIWHRCPQILADYQIPPDCHVFSLNLHTGGNDKLFWSGGCGSMHWEQVLSRMIVVEFANFVTLLRIGAIN